ncbi:MAG: molybdate ABC transporter substrate-binding protein [Candidatus Krumholzibacteria bacterium]|nr:molybdate ABC transporter substrate-binding protein [Candidatus Krumholzibacteria bacterium]
MEFSRFTRSTHQGFGLLIGIQIVFVVGLVGLPGVAFPEQVHVAVAANFADCLDQLGTAFEESTGHELIVSQGSTGKHFAQIKAGAPFDVFFAADSERPALLEADGLTVSGSRFTYAVGRLVLWMPRAEPDSSTSVVEVLKSPGYRHLAIANPRLAPYGLAAKQTLISLGVWVELEPRLVMGQSVGQTWQFVATGNAQLGLVAQSQFAASENSSGSWWDIDADLHDPIEQQAVLMLSAAENAAAKMLMDFVRGPEARLIIETYGYTVPED